MQDAAEGTAQILTGHCSHMKRNGKKTVNTGQEASTAERVTRLRKAFELDETSVGISETFCFPADDHSQINTWQWCRQQATSLSTHFRQVSIYTPV